MAVIRKKIDPVWFELILSGKKKFEKRLADFDLAEGDILILEEWMTDSNGRKPTGREIRKIVKYFQKENYDEWLKKQPELKEKGFYVIQFD